MQLYRGTASALSNEITSGTLIPLLQRRFAERMLYTPSTSEATSWARSLPEVAKELLAAGLRDVEVLVEYFLPLTSKRADVVVIGSHPSTNAISAVVWENKQWTTGDIEDIDGRLVSVAGRLLLHPQQQVSQYVEYLNDFNHLAHDGSLVVSGMAFLHNATSAEVAPFRLAELADLAAFPIFSGDEVAALHNFLLERVSGKGASAAADDFLQARTSPSKQLLTHVQEQIQGHDAFTLLDEQLVAFEVVSRAVDQARRSNDKKVVIVKGGPGTGKSVIATAIIGDLAKRGYNVSHATGSRSFTTTLRQRVGSRAGNLFRYFNSFMSADQNDLDVLVADEAHRIRKTSNNRFTKKALRSDLRQVDELMRVARVPVFLLDENQSVRPDEIGTVDEIKDAAQTHGFDIIEIDLNAQFRSGGSEAYFHWVQRLLGIVGNGPIAWEGDERFELYAANSPDEMEAWLSKKNDDGFTSRMAAGFCWEWSDPIDGILVEDVVIGEWHRPWNLKPEKRVRGVPSSNLWASDPGGFGQVGCIYTAQGFEYDYGGVILGDDMVWRSGNWVSDKSKSADPGVKRSDNFDELVRHTYRVLLTRGLRGCLIYSVDRETRDYLKSMGINYI
jgi:hypothetical protein